MKQKSSLVVLVASIASMVAIACPWTVAAAENSYVPAHGNAIILFDGKDLGNFDGFLKTISRSQR
jgi:hypothetical protein